MTNQASEFISLRLNIFSGEGYVKFYATPNFSFQLNRFKPDILFKRKGLGVAFILLTLRISLTAALGLRSLSAGPLRNERANL